MKFYRKPLGKLCHELRKRGLLILPRDRKLHRLEGAYSGKTAVLVGTGPSLKISDLERLKNVTTFACNKIYLAFDKTEWRPDFYSICDFEVANACLHDVRNSLPSATRVMHSPLLRSLDWGKLSPLYYRYASQTSMLDWDGKSDPEAPMGFADGIISGGCSVQIDQLQIAYLLGFTKIYLIGADLSYFGIKETGESGVSGSLMEVKDSSNYFHPNYYKAGEITTVPRIKEMKNAWAYCYRMLADKGVTLLNASRETALETVPRVDFDEVFPP